MTREEFIEVLQEIRQQLQRSGIGEAVFADLPIQQTHPHFDVADWHGNISFRLYTDIECRTLGSSRIRVNDRSEYHELDLVVVEPNCAGRRGHDEIALGVECKSTLKFSKNIVREALGVRRELCLLRDRRRSKLSTGSPLQHSVLVPAEPASEHWLAFVDPAGLNYRESPETFGIEFKYWRP